MSGNTYVWINHRNLGKGESIKSGTIKEGKQVREWKGMYVE